MMKQAISININTGYNLVFPETYRQQRIYRLSTIYLQQINFLDVVRGSRQQSCTTAGKQVGNYTTYNIIEPHEIFAYNAPDRRASGRMPAASAKIDGGVQSGSPRSFLAVGAHVLRDFPNAGYSQMVVSYDRRCFFFKQQLYIAAFERREWDVWQNFFWDHTGMNVRVLGSLITRFNRNCLHIEWLVFICNFI